MTSCLGSSARSRRSRTRSEAVLSRPSFRPRCLSRRWSFMCPLPRARSLPLGVGRAALVRSGPSGSAGRGDRHAKGRVAVRHTLPLGVGRAVSARSGPSGSAGRGDRHAKGRVAVRHTLPLGVGRAALVALKSEWQCGALGHVSATRSETCPHVSCREAFSSTSGS